MTKRDQGNTLQSFDDLQRAGHALSEQPLHGGCAPAHGVPARQSMAQRRSAHRGVLPATQRVRRRGEPREGDRRTLSRIAAAGDALAIMVDCYKELGQEKLADDAERVLKLNYPDHPFFTGHFPPHGHWWGRDGAVPQLINPRRINANVVNASRT